MNIVIFITCANREEAGKIAEALVKKKEAACVNIIGAVESVFWWQGKIDKSKETLLIVKSKKDRFDRIVSLVKRLHSYDLPEIIAFDISKGEKKYLSWINESVG